MVGAVRFELTTSCTRNKRASQATLRPDAGQTSLPASAKNAMEFSNLPGKHCSNSGKEVAPPVFLGQA